MIEEKLIEKYAQNCLNERELEQVEALLQTSPEFAAALAIYLQEEMLFAEVMNASAPAA